MNKENGDRILFTQHNYNFYTHCGFLGISYNPNKPALKFVALVQDKFKELELSWSFEEALAVRALGDIEHYPALSVITNEMATRLMVAGDSLIMIMPENKPHDPQQQQEHEWQQPPELILSIPPNNLNPPPPPPHHTEPVSPTTALRHAHFKPIYTGHRANEKNSDLIFKVHEALLEGSIGRALRIVVEKRPHKKNSGIENGALLKSASHTLKLEFYYSTSLLQQILIAMEAVGQSKLKKDLARNLCKYLVIDENGSMSKGLPELKFDVHRIRQNFIMIDGLPGKGQRELNNRLSELTSVPQHSTSTHPTTTAPRSLGRTALLSAPSTDSTDSTGSTRPQWAGTHMKVLTSSEINQTPKGSATSDLLYRDTMRAITPDSVVLHRRLGMDGTYEVPSVMGGPMRMFNSSVNQWRNKAMLPNERLAALPPKPPKNPNQRRDLMFYAGKRKFNRRSKQQRRIHNHTVASESGLWENRNQPKAMNDLLMSHNHRSPHSVGKLNVWNEAVNTSGGLAAASPLTRRKGEYTGRKSTVRAVNMEREQNGRKSSKCGAFRTAAEVQYVNTDSVKAAKSIVRERAARDGIFGNSIQVGFAVV